MKDNKWSNITKKIVDGYKPKEKDKLKSMNEKKTVLSKPNQNLNKKNSKEKREHSGGKRHRRITGEAQALSSE